MNGIEYAVVYIVIVRKSEHKLEFREGGNRIVGLEFMVCVIIICQCYTEQEYEDSLLS